jgi:glycosyltransferase involved in cell wall biosynthesis
MTVATVIVPVRNGSTQVRELLELLDRQTVGRNDFEVVIADDGSTDDLLQQLEGRPGVIVSAAPPAHTYVARNRGARVATGEALVFCDADCRPEPTWLENGLRALAAADVVGGKINWLPGERRSIWMLLGIDQFIDQETAIATGAGLGGNLFVRRELFERLGGFDESVSSSGDYEFVARCARSRARIVFAADAVVWHPTYEGREFLRKYVRVNARYALREGRAGRRPDALKLRNWVPVIQTLRARRRFGRSLLLNRRRLEESGLRATPEEQVLAALMIYLVLAYIRCLAQLWGYLQGRAEARRGLPLTGTG